MTQKQLNQQIEAVLRRRREALRQSLTGELGQFRSSHNNYIVGDPVDAAVDNEYAEINSELAETEGRELARIERALERLREGRYGICEGCGKKIPRARLQALPYATMCVECQTRSERGEANPRDRNSRPPFVDLSESYDQSVLESFDLME